MMEIIKGAPESFSVLSGDDSLTLPLMALGGTGCVSVVSNEVPKEFSDMVNAALGGNWKKAKEFHFKLLDLMNANFIETNPIPVKTSLALMGKIKEVFRLPLVKITDKNRQALSQVLKEQGLI